MRNLKVGDVMSREFVSVKPDTSLIRCAELIVKNKIGFLIVSKNGELSGILTGRDILWTITKMKSKDTLKFTKAGDVATKNPKFITPEITVEKAVLEMRHFNVDRMPIVEDNKVVGIISFYYLIKMDPDLIEELEEKQIK